MIISSIICKSLIWKNDNTLIATRHVPLKNKWKVPEYHFLLFLLFNLKRATFSLWFISNYTVLANLLTYFNTNNKCSDLFDNRCVLNKFLIHLSYPVNKWKLEAIHLKRFFSVNIYKFKKKLWFSFILDMNALSTFWRRGKFHYSMVN